MRNETRISLVDLRPEGVRFLGVSGVTQRYHKIPRGAIKVPVPNTNQNTGSSCGASCMQSICRHYGVGPKDKREYVADLQMDRRVGSHPHQIKRLVRKYGLRYREYLPMTRWQLIENLRDVKPAMLMIQAWGESEEENEHHQSYKGIWRQGHWVIAIGYDKTGVFFEDPFLQAARGYLSFRELDERWHDTGPHGKHMEHYGLVIWKPRVQKSAYLTQAERIS